MTGILTLNAGSSSIKFALYRAAATLEQIVSGQVDGIGQTARLVLRTGQKQTSHPVEAPSQSAALDAVMQVLEPLTDGTEISGVGHRILHGGPDFGAPEVLTPDIMQALTALEPLAPLHQPHNLAAVRVAEARFPQAMQIGCFDTGFHSGRSQASDSYALPGRFYDEGIRRFGFHGLSCAYISGALADQFPELHQGRVIVAHLGNGASMCAMKGGVSLGSSMGFSALDGLPMGTRCGQLDPGVMLYLMEQKGMSAAELSQLLYCESGLLGMSGLTNDMRELLASDKPEAKLAIEHYITRAGREIGALTAELGGLDGLVFCGGVGENAAPIRAGIAEGLDYLGIQVDDARNCEGAGDIGAGPARVLVIPTDEEQVIAQAVQLELARHKAARAA